MSERWWIVMADDGYKITNHPLRSTDPVRGPFSTYDAAYEYKEWWERKQMSRERMADNIHMFELFAKIKADLLPDHVVSGVKFSTEWLCTWP